MKKRIASMIRKAARAVSESEPGKERELKREYNRLPAKSKAAFVRKLARETGARR